MSLKAIARRVLGPLPQWAAVGIIPPQRAISVSLDWPGHAIDITQNHTVASLRPLTIAINLPGDNIASATVIYRDNATAREIGFLCVRRFSVRSVGRNNIGLFEIEQAGHRCLGWPRRKWNEALQARTIRRNRNPHNFQMAPAAVQQLMTFYISPRPVVLVSVSDISHSNVFPMDLIGPLGESCFTLALRSTSISVPAMVSARRVAISSIGAEHKNSVYKLGEHHKKPFADWSALPFPITSTDKFTIPAIASALRIRELAVESSESLGSHTFFVCNVVSDRELAAGLQLHHTAGFHQEFRRRRGDAFSAA